MSMFSGDLVSQIINMFMWIFVLGFVFPKLVVYQMLVKLEQSTIKLETMSKKARETVLGKISKKPDKKLKDQVRNFMEFFAIPPVDLDPYGIVKKFDHLVDQEKDRFKYFVNQISPKSSEEEKANIMMGLSGSMGLYQLTKIVRHFLELTKKTKSQYYAMMLQMQLPLIERIAKSLVYGTEALSNGWVIGDGIGPYIAANYIGSDEVKIDEENAVCKKKRNGKEIIVIKAKGPGGRTGNPGKILEQISKKEKIAKIITIDAAAKLEGEETGSVAEGIGVAMGGIGVERSYIEDVAVRNKIPIDSIIVKMSQEEAIMSMKKPILDAVPKVMEILDETVDRTKDKGAIVIIGVGNTSGVENDGKNVKKIGEEIKKVNEKIKKREKSKKKRFKSPF